MQALVVAAHGSHLNPHAATPAYAHADAIRETDAFDEVQETFWKETPSFREVLRTLEADEAFVVPLFVSEGYFTEQVLPRELRLDGWTPALWESDGTSASHATLRAVDVGTTVHYCGPVGTHDAMADVVVRRAERVTGDPDVGAGVGLAVIGHGTERNEHSARAIEYHADRLRARSRFDEVQALFMDEAPRVEELTSHLDSDEVVVVPLFVAEGYHTREDIPEDLGLTDDASSGWKVPATVDGTRLWYAGAVGTEALVADVVLERAADAGAAIGDARHRLRRVIETDARRRVDPERARRTELNLRDRAAYGSVDRRPADGGDPDGLGTETRLVPDGGSETRLVPGDGSEGALVPDGCGEAQRQVDGFGADGRRDTPDTTRRGDRP